MGFLIWSENKKFEKVFLEFMDRNLPDPLEKFVVPNGLNKLEFKKTKESPNAGTFTLLCEDHTIGYLVQCMLLKNNHVIFAGYRLPHPMKNTISIHLKTDGARILNPKLNLQIPYTPSMAFKHALIQLEEGFTALLREFTQDILIKNHLD